ncbi:MAG: substrate-binding domain-containing protein [Bacteroidaceae bacterium]|nr:substrate-binding domain-containing protein [Bacteroidaceae bacterium]
MKKLTIYAIMILVVIPILFACKGDEKKKPRDTISSGMITLCADESFEPIIEQEILVFESLYPDANIIPIYTDERNVMNLFLQDSVRMAIATRQLSEAEKNSMKQRNFMVREIRIAIDGIALITNKENPDTLITMSNLKKILTGEIDSWKQLNPNSKAGKLQLVFDNPNSSSVRFAIDSICKGDSLSPNLTAQQTNKGVIDFVSKNEGAIGVIGVSWIGDKSDSTNLTFLNNLRVMSVSTEDTATPENSYKPYQAYIQLQKYPLRRNIYILLNNTHNGLSVGFSTFMASDRGQRIILKAGILPATQPVRAVKIKR